MRHIQLVLVSGLSGAGRTSALKKLEDFGYEVIDNLPLSLIKPLVDYWRKINDNSDEILLNNPTKHNIRFAIGVDTRTQDFNYLQQFLDFLNNQNDLCLRILFLDCDDGILLRRYNESRRKHPLDDSSLDQAITKERLALEPIKQRAEYFFDTSYSSTQELGEYLANHFQLNNNKLVVNLFSFSYKLGIPRNVDLIFDLRCLVNPYYIAELKKLSGKDQLVKDFITQQPAWSNFWHYLKGFIDLSLEGFKKNGRSYLSMAFGCTGGQHRSVFVSEIIFEHLQQELYKTNLYHRDLTKP